jgi:hypothetical protein
VLYIGGSKGLVQQNRRSMSEVYCSAKTCLNRQNCITYRLVAVLCSGGDGNGRD